MNLPVNRRVLQHVIPLASAFFASVIGVLAISSPAGGQVAYGVTTEGNLVRWRSGEPQNILRSDPIPGLQPGEVLLGIDFRPDTRVLYGLGSTGHIYRINRQSLVEAIMVSDGPMDPALDGTVFGFDFNAVADRIRIVSDAGQNLRINPHTLDDSVGDPLFYAAGDANEGAAPNVVHAAHTNNFPGATGTTLYDIDSAMDSLVRQDPVAAGMLTTIGELGLDVAVRGGLDIYGLDDRAFAAFQREGSDFSEYFSIDLDTGEATLIGPIGDGLVITAMSLIPVPEPTAAALAAIAIFALAAGATRRRCRRFLKAPG